MGSLSLRLKLWAKRWLLWHYPCPFHGVLYTEKTIDPDCSWDGGMLTYCTECQDFCIEIDRRQKVLDAYLSEWQDEPIRCARCEGYELPQQPHALGCPNGS